LEKVVSDAGIGTGAACSPWKQREFTTSGNIVERRGVNRDDWTTARRFFTLGG
jgi:hypothetical protein